MIDTKDLKSNSVSPSQTKVESQSSEPNIFESGLDKFRQLFSDVEASSTEDKQTQSPAKQYPALSSESIVDIASEVTRSVFSDSPFEQSGLRFGDDEVALLQQSLIGALKTSLLKSSLSSPATSEASPALSPQEAPSQNSLTDFLSSVKEISFGSDGFGLKDAFDTLNILNHIPVVSDFYKESTKNDVDAFSTVTGSYLIGGPIGAAFAIADVATEELTGQSIFGNLVEFGKETFSNFWEDTPGTQPQTNPAQLKRIPQPHDFQRIAE